MNYVTPNGAALADLDAGAMPQDVQAMRMLWAEVFRLALLDLQGRGWQLSAKSRELMRDRAAAWVRSDARGVGSFDWLCLLFDLDADRIRAVVLPQPTRRQRRRRG